MAVEKIGEKYRCNVCGNEVEVIEVGGGILVCCGQDMERIEVETPDVTNIPDADGF
jgi:desulfoferrodoxin-like iron-binding protein